MKTVKVKMHLNRSSADVTKELKQKLRVLNIGTNRASFSQMGLNRPSGMRLSEHSSGSSRRSTAGTSKDANKEDRDELGLYLFKTLARNKVLAFKKF